MKGKINVYTCAHGHQTVTIDRDEGVTPLMLRCRQRVNDGHHDCTEMASSAGYRCDQKLAPQFEWYKPDAKHPLNMSERAHVQNGGLLLREIQKSSAANATPPPPPPHLKPGIQIGQPYPKNEERILDGIIKKHLTWNPSELRMLSARQFVESGTVSGSLAIAIKKVVREFIKTKHRHATSGRNQNG